MIVADRVVRVTGLGILLVFFVRGCRVVGFVGLACTCPPMFAPGLHLPVLCPPQADFYYHDPPSELVPLQLHSLPRSCLSWLLPFLFVRQDISVRGWFWSYPQGHSPAVSFSSILHFFIVAPSTLIDQFHLVCSLAHDRQLAANCQPELTSFVRCLQALNH